MNTIYSIRIINIFSLIFILMNYIFNNFQYQGINFSYFLVICTITIVGFRLRKVKRIYSFLPVINIILLAFTSSVTQVVFIVIVAAISIYILYREIYKAEYDMFLIEFRRGIFLIAGTLAFSLLTFSFRVFRIVSIPYVLIYLISSIILLRSLRYVKYNCYSMGTKKSGIIIISIGVLTSVILSMEIVRKTFLSVLENTYLFMVDKLVDLIISIFYPLLYLLEKLILIIQRKLPKLNKSQEIVDSNTLKPQLDNINKKSIVELILGSRAFIIIMNVFIVLIALYILYRVINRVVKNGKQREYYIEEKEFIVDKDSNGLFKKILKTIKAKNDSERIRLNYIRFLNLCRKRGIIIQNSDTTMDINDNARKVFDEKLIKQIRGIYIDVRYGNKKMGEGIVNDFSKTVNKLKKRPDISNIR